MIKNYFTVLVSLSFMICIYLKLNTYSFEAQLLPFIPPLFYLGLQIYSNLFKRYINTQNLLKFLCHIEFLIFCELSIVKLFKIIYSTLFYYGFVNTLVIIKILFVVFLSVSNVFPRFKNYMIQHLKKTNFGQKMLMVLNYYYNTWIISTKICEKIINVTKIGFMTIFKICKYCFLNLYYANQNLSENDQSKLIQEKITNKIGDMKNYTCEKYLKPYFIESLQKSLMINPFEKIDNNFDLNDALNENSEEILDDLEDIYDVPNEIQEREKSINEMKNLFKKVYTNDITHVPGYENLNNLSKIFSKNIDKMMDQMVIENKKLNDTKIKDDIKKIN